jgi:hypothetical protein
VLSDFEATRKNESTGAFIDMCNTCVAESGILSLIPVIEREDLRGIVDDVDDDLVVGEVYEGDFKCLDS